MSWWTKGVLIVCVGLSMTACNHKQERIHAFYNIDSLVSTQINYLANRKSVIHKVGTINDADEQADLQHGDTLMWKKELDVFRQLDLNKPINLQNYTVEDGLADPSSNLKIRKITATKSLPVEYVKIYYQVSPENPRRIEGLVQEENMLYSSKRYLKMDLQGIRGKSIIVAYTIAGGQKMIFGDSVNYSVKATITYPDK